MSNEHTEQPPSVIDEPKDLIACFHGARAAVVLCFIYFAIALVISGVPALVHFLPILLLTLAWHAASWGVMGGSVGLLVARTPNSLVAMITGAILAAVCMYGYAFVRGPQELPIERSAYYGFALVGGIAGAMAKRATLTPSGMKKNLRFSILDVAKYVLIAAICVAWIGEEYREMRSKRIIFAAGGRIVWTGSWGIEFHSQPFNQQPFEESKLKDLAPALRRFPNLRLCLDSCKLSSIGVKELETLPNLELILVDPSMYSKAEIQELRDWLPHVKIVTDSSDYSVP